MRRYFFDLREGGTLKPDPNGAEFATIDAMREEAAKLLADLARDNVLRNGRTRHETFQSKFAISMDR